MPILVKPETVKSRVVLGCFCCLEITVGSTSLKNDTSNSLCTDPRPPPPPHLGDMNTGYLDEGEYDVKNYVGRGECYLPRPKILLPTPALFLKLPVCTKAGSNNCFITHSKSHEKARKMLPRCKGPFYKIFPIPRQFQNIKGSLFW